MAENNPRKNTEKIRCDFMRMIASGDNQSENIMALFMVAGDTIEMLIRKQEKAKKEKDDDYDIMLLGLKEMVLNMDKMLSKVSVSEDQLNLARINNVITF